MSLFNAHLRGLPPSVQFDFRPFSSVVAFKTFFRDAVDRADVGLMKLFVFGVSGPGICAMLAVSFWVMGTLVAPWLAVAIVLALFTAWAIQLWHEWNEYGAFVLHQLALVECYAEGSLPTLQPDLCHYLKVDRPWFVRVHVP